MNLFQINSYSLDERLTSRKSLKIYLIKSIVRELIRQWLEQIAYLESSPETVRHVSRLSDEEAALLCAVKFGSTFPRETMKFGSWIKYQKFQTDYKQISYIILNKVFDWIELNSVLVWSDLVWSG
uniref:Uncharacterized protein n=1 Tax=Vespula pensylvanica TaxID=30213 RepID=A0A834PGK5_VESPE|nr:hypothetical protein H0235_001892 [Vespula pensylvanica]